MKEVTGLVAQQYTAYAYPQPTEDLDAWAAGGGVDLLDPSVYGPVIWPERRSNTDLDILIAGCGTQQAAMFAYRNRGSRVVGVDLSPTSLAHQRFLREKHGLDNLELYQGDLLEVGRLQRSFDLVVSSGVLHHMADPAAGLLALRDVLRPAGVLAAMVYGAIGRIGIYPLQDAFRRMGVGQTPEGVAVVRAALERLPALHPARCYTLRTAELEHDTALVDTFLHPQDRAFEVAELLAWIEGAGLEFQGWCQNQFYYPQAFIDEPARSLIATLPEREQWSVVEKLYGLGGTHSFLARRPGQTVKLDFSGSACLSYRPTLLACALGEVGPDGRGHLLNDHLRLPLEPGEVVLVQGVDRRRPISELIDQPALASFPRDVRESFGRAVFERLWKSGVVMFEI